jgi:hypothetical protein
LPSAPDLGISSLTQSIIPDSKPAASKPEGSVVGGGKKKKYRTPRRRRASRKRRSHK